MDLHTWCPGGNDTLDGAKTGSSDVTRCIAYGHCGAAGWVEACSGQRRLHSSKASCRFESKDEIAIKTFCFIS